MNKKKTKKNQQPKIVEILNSPRTIIIFLILVLIGLSISLFFVKGSYVFYSGEFSSNELAVAEIHYYSSPTTTYFYADNTIYGGEDKQINSIRIGYGVKVKDTYKIIDESYKEFEKPVSIKEAILLYSKFKKVELRNEPNKVFTKEVKNNMDNLYLLIEVTTKDNQTVKYEEKIQLYKVNK